MSQLLAIISFFLTLSLGKEAQNLPNIIFILIDDLGWNDISIHNGSDFATPNIDQLAREGLLLDNYYIQFLCSPTRSAFVSGRYPIHTGFQHGVLLAEDPYGLPLKNTLLPQDLKRAGYDTHMIGKWNCGFFNEKYVPDKRGFDTFFGYYTAHEDYFYHNKSSSGGDKGYDFRNNSQKIIMNGQYSTYLYGNATNNILKNYDGNTPFFIYLATQAVHGPLEAPQDVIDSYALKNISNMNRRIYAAMMTVADMVIGELVNTLKNEVKNEVKIWDNTLIVLSTDNGGASWVGGNNYPLRGSKATLFEGGVKGVGIVSGGYLNKKRIGQSSTEMMHITDWYPTLCDVANISPTNQTNLDGFSMLDVIQDGNVKSNRTEILLNIDPSGCNFTETTICGGIIMNEWKLIVGHSAMSQAPCYLNSSYKGTKPTTVWCPLNQTDERSISVKCQGIQPAVNDSFYTVAPYNGKPCLFNLKQDPCEYNNVIAQNNQQYQKLLQRLLYYNSTMIPPLQIGRPAQTNASNPKWYGGFWSPWSNQTDFTTSAEYESMEYDPYSGTDDQVIWL